MKRASAVIGTENAAEILANGDEIMNCEDGQLFSTVENMR